MDVLREADAVEVALFNELKPLESFAEKVEAGTTAEED